MAAAVVAHLYNALPTLGHADDQFVNRNPVFAQLAELLAKYDNAYGICLVHSHCKLADGEITLAKGDISEPVQIALIEQHYPERWLANGTPYEFSTLKTDDPPQDLVKEFYRITQGFGLQNILGFYHIQGSQDAPAIIEWTEGRKNLTRVMTEEDESAQQVQTAWNFGRGSPITMACTIVCDIRTTRSEKPNKHKGTQSHPKGGHSI
ncbi:uncharacterized protein G6M90_00g080960 [Metarhizium brunneum]|uniref:Uncharacterized protein n=1 Tax=Metarhizium brunneum TaxID=500148 RepID=A0A7D5YXG3_9HYPO|nr:hypothetical protein G6M90_00g080960 [Metarhizium brunneum]